MLRLVYDSGGLIEIWRNGVILTGFKDLLRQSDTA